jgi:hypothetical protein
VGPVPDPLLLRISGSAGNWTRDSCVSSQKLWPVDHRGGHATEKTCRNTGVTSWVPYLHPGSQATRQTVSVSCTFSLHEYGMESAGQGESEVLMCIQSNSIWSFNSIQLPRTATTSRLKVQASSFSNYSLPSYVALCVTAIMSCQFHWWHNQPQEYKFEFRSHETQIQRRGDKLYRGTNSMTVTLFSVVTNPLW